MIVEGTNVIHGAAPERVFQALADPAVLARVVPGCQELVDRGDGVYDLKIEAGVGSIRGAYAGQVQVKEARASELYEATLSAGGPPGSVSATLRADLRAEESGTAVDYKMDAQLTGPIAGVGQRVAAGVSKKNAQSFFKALERELSSNGDGAAAPAAAEPAAQPAAAGAQAAAAAPAAQAGTAYSGRAAEGSGDRFTWFLGGLIAGALLTVLGVFAGRRG